MNSMTTEPQPCTLINYKFLVIKRQQDLLFHTIFHREVDLYFDHLKLLPPSQFVKDIEILDQAVTLFFDSYCTTFASDR